MATNAEKRPEFLAKMMAVSPRHEPEVEEAQQTLKESRPAVPTPMLDVVLRDGKIRSFSYAYLAEVEFEPGDTLTLKLSNGAAIIAEGRGLHVIGNKCGFTGPMRSGECSETELALQTEGLSQVERIHITEGDK